MDSVEQFVEEQCVVDVDAVPVTASCLLEVYQDYLDQLRQVSENC